MTVVEVGEINLVDQFDVDGAVVRAEDAEAAAHLSDLLFEDVDVYAAGTVARLEAQVASVTAELAQAEVHVAALIDAMRIVGAEGGGVPEDGIPGRAFAAAIAWVAARNNWCLDSAGMSAVARHCAQTGSGKDGRTVSTKSSTHGWGEPAPDNSKGGDAVWEAVIADMKSRDAFGRAKYGVPLCTNNGRDALKDLYEELLDACVYLKQAMMERDARGEPCGK